MGSNSSNSARGTSVLSHHIKIFKVQQFSNPWIVSEVIHGKAHNACFWNKWCNFSASEFKRQKYEVLHACLNIQILWYMQTFDTRLQLKMKLASKHTIENTSSDKFVWP